MQLGKIVSFAILGVLLGAISGFAIPYLAYILLCDLNKCSSNAMETLICLVIPGGILVGGFIGSIVGVEVLQLKTGVVDCGECGGRGHFSHEYDIIAESQLIHCSKCDGTGKITNQIWRDCFDFLDHVREILNHIFMH